MTQKDIQKIIEGLTPNIQDVIEKKVNGKIDKISTILQDQNKTFGEFKTKVETHIANDDEWKTEFSPYVKGLANMTGSAKIAVWLSIGVGSIIATIIAIKKFFL